MAPASKTALTESRCRKCICGNPPARSISGRSDLGASVQLLQRDGKNVLQARTSPEHDRRVNSNSYENGSRSSGPKTVTRNGAAGSRQRALIYMGSRDSRARETSVGSAAVPHRRVKGGTRDVREGSDLAGRGRFHASTATGAKLLTTSRRLHNDSAAGRDLAGSPGRSAFDPRAPALRVHR